MAVELKSQLNVETELIVGHAGEFTVWVDGEKVAEKAAGLFPEPSAVVAAVAAKRA